jgi:hypothetical protein
MTLRNAPLSGRDVRTNAPDLPDVLSEIFFQMGIDTIWARLPVGQIRLVPFKKNRPAGTTRQSRNSMPAARGWVCDQDRTAMVTQSSSAGASGRIGCDILSGDGVAASFDRHDFGAEPKSSAPGAAPLTEFA